MLSVEEIQNTINLLFDDGEPFEVRTIGTGEFKTIHTGYFIAGNNEKLIKKLIKKNKGDDRNPPANIFLTLNPVAEDVLSRTQDVLKKSKTATVSEEIAYVKRLLIDLDPIRYKDISSTNEERFASMKMGSEIIDFLKSEGFGTPIYAESGNGTHVSYEIEKNLDIGEAVQTNKKILSILANKFSNTEVDIDLAVSDAPRISKLYGTTAIKGRNTEKRPHRKSKIITGLTRAELSMTKKATLEAFVEKYKDLVSAPTKLENASRARDVIDDIIPRNVKLNKVFSGDLTDYNKDGKDDRSSAEQYLISVLLYITSDSALTSEIMEQSLTGKWTEEKDQYKERSIAAAESFLSSAGNTLYATNSKLSEMKFLFEHSASEMSLKEINCIKNSRDFLKMDLDLLGKSHFVNKVVDYFSVRTDGYKEYQIVSALWLLSSFVERRICIELNNEEVYPNIWVQLLGDSSVSRKSTIVKKIRKIYSEVVGAPSYNDDYSIEGYMEILERDPVSCFLRDESSGLIAKMHKKYNEGIFAFECSMFDGQDHRKTLTGSKKKDKDGNRVSNELIIGSPYVTKLLATTPENFIGLSELGDFLSGYGYRFLYCFPEYSKPWLDISQPTDEEKKLEEILITDAKTIYHEIASFDGILLPRISVEAMRVLNDSDKLIAHYVADLDGRLKSASARLFTYVVKLAVLIEIGKENFTMRELEISEHSVEVAVHLVTQYFLPTFARIITKIVEDSKYNMVDKVVQILEENSGIATRTTVMRGAKFGSTKTFDEVINSMIESKAISVIREKGMKTIYYRLEREHQHVMDYTITSKEQKYILPNSKKQRNQTTGKIMTQKKLSDAPKEDEDLWGE